MRKFDLFPTSVYLSKFERHNDVVKYMHEEILPSYTEYNNSTQCNVYSDYFPNAKRLDNDLFRKFYDKPIKDFLTQMRFSVKDNWNIDTVFWYNITEKGGWQEMHDHVSSPKIVNFSAIHYVKFAPDHQPVEFRHPNEQVIRAIQPSEIQEDNPYMFQNLSLSPSMSEGDIIFFPSYLKHSVPVQKSDKQRISIAMNIGITKNDE
jgi:uncharacterized protein (TIGR02466 family)